MEWKIAEYIVHRGQVLTCLKCAVYGVHAVSGVCVCGKGCVGVCVVYGMWEYVCMYMW